MNAKIARPVNKNSTYEGAAILSSSLESVFVPDMSMEDELEYDGIPSMAQWMGRIASDQSYARRQQELPQSFVGEYEFLSNMHICVVEIGGMIFPSAENAFQAMKCKTRKEMEAFQYITPQEAKKRGKTVDARSNWSEIRIPVMRKILEAKFSDQELAIQLLKTGDMALCEKNWWGDDFWGKCPKDDNHYFVDGEEVTKRQYDEAIASEAPHTYKKVEKKVLKGENHLGKLLCEVRDEIGKSGIYAEYLRQFADKANIDVSWL